MRSGARRITPHFDVWLVQLAGQEGTHVRWDLGHVRSDQARRFQEDQDWIGDLGRRLSDE